MSHPEIVTIGRPLLPDPADVAALLGESVAVGWLSNGGPLHDRLEHQLAPWLGGGEMRLVSSGTMALMLALRAGNLPDGAEIITSPISFAATVQAILWCGFRPVFADVDPETLTLCPAAVRAAITPRTAAILPVHLLGVPCDVTTLQAIAREHGLWLVYDAAHAFGTTLNGVPLAQWGDASAFSLHATKLMHTAEGGAVVVPGSDATTLTRMRNFGLLAGRMDGIGTNAKLSEPQAAVGLAVLPLLDAEIAARQRLRSVYDAALGHLPRIRAQPTRPGASVGLLYYALRIPAEQRARIFLALADARIFARDFFPLLCGAGTCLPDSRIVTTAPAPLAPQLAPELICLPFHGAVTENDVARIADIVEKESR